MRVLIACDTTGWMIGGVTNELIQLVAGLAKNGATVGLLNDRLPDGCQPYRHYPLTVPIQGRLEDEATRAIADFRPDLVHVLGLRIGVTPRFGRIVKPIPWVETIHAVPPHERILRGLHGSDALHYAVRSMRFLPNVVAWRLALARRMFPFVIVHSEFVANAAARFGYPRERLAVIPIGLDVGSQPRAPAERSLKPGEGIRLMAVGGIAHTKGHHDLILTIKHLQDKRPGSTLDLVGENRDDSYLKYLRRLVSALGLESQVRFHLSATREAKHRLFACTDVYAQPSHEEGFCLAFAEACLSVRRCVGTETGAIAKLADGDQGLRVVPVRRPDLLTEAVESVCRTGVSDVHMDARLERLREFLSWECYIRQHLDVYRRVIKRGTGVKTAE